MNALQENIFHILATRIPDSLKTAHTICPTKCLIFCNFIFVQVIFMFCMNGVLIFVCPVPSCQLTAFHSVGSSCNNKRPSSVLECKIPEGLSWPWSSEHNSRQPVFANGASHNTSSSRRWSEWNWLHFPQHWGVYGIRAKWKLTGKWHLWRYIKMLFYVLFLSLSLWCSSVSVIRLWTGRMRNHHSMFCRWRNFRSSWQPPPCLGGCAASCSWVWIGGGAFVRGNGARAWSWLTHV